MKKSMPNKLLMTGLGNPGEEYKDTPHNAGFLVIEALLKAFGVEASLNKKFHSEIAEHKFGKTKIIFAKPQTFMNKSGSAVKPLALYFKIKPEDSLWLIHDDMDLPLGKIRIVKNRGSAGHKGVLDVIKKLRTKNFVRFRVGIRSKNIKDKRSKSMMNKLVASRVSKNDQRLFKKSLKLAHEAILLALEEGIEKSTSIYNAK